MDSSNEIINTQNRVYALYRVSTLAQVEKDDIPMQKQRCREFAAAQGWNIVREFAEKGVSGFKISAKDRDAIQEIQRDAAEGMFDILLVFMFDRLGRRDDETPFVVEWFVKHGIEVWSAMEGQQRFDTHVDKLMNYIRYWQASGESLKTSVRVKTRLGQLTEDGLYTGGHIPFGYKLVKNGRTNKRSREVSDLTIDEREAAIVKLIFHKYVNEGYGALRLCHFLHDNGFQSRGGNGFPNTTINRIIKNILYTGILKNGGSQSAYINELRIVDDETFAKAQEIMRQRIQPHSEIPLNCKGRSLLVGNIYCAHCGNRLTLTTSGRRKRASDGAYYNETRARYQCHYNVRHPGECDGQSGYSVAKVDNIVEEIIRAEFAQIATTSASELLAVQHRKEIELAKQKAERAAEVLQEKEKDLADFKKETIKVIRGQSNLSSDLLNSLIAETQVAVSDAQKSLEIAEKEYADLKRSAENLQKEFDKLMNWADLYDNCSFEAKKMIAAQLIQSVKVGRDYAIEINFNVSFEEFQHRCIQRGEQASEPKRKNQSA
ncbi:MAG: recombinase family protein [Clostridiaceae bacterium]|nr:recombinase family protein [Clostridiaceae bacterium]